MKNEEQKKIAEELYESLKSIEIDVLIDDRDERTGVKFNDADLIGIPIRITVGNLINEGKVEVKLRSTNDSQKCILILYLERIRKVYNKMTVKL